jgi:hypothetical protein
MWKPEMPGKEERLASVEWKANPGWQLGILGFRMDDNESVVSTTDTEAWEVIRKTG